jgi:hypothetical protein
MEKKIPNKHQLRAHSRKNLKKKQLDNKSLMINQLVLQKLQIEISEKPSKRLLKLLTIKIKKMLTRLPRILPQLQKLKMRTVVSN